MQKGLLIVTAAIVAVLTIEVTLLTRNQAGERFYTTLDRERTAMVDRLVMTDSADAFKRGRLKDAMLANDPSGPVRVTLDRKERKGYPRDGQWISPVVSTEFAVTEVLPSWNVITPQQTGVLFHVRTRDAATAKWSPWLRIGSWGRVNDKRSLAKSQSGYVDEDTLKLSRPADAYQIRATLQSFAPSLDLTPSIRRIAVAYSGPVNENSAWAKSLTPAPLSAEKWAVDLKVPYIPQGDNDFAVTGMTCSPTSLTMVLQHFGVNRDAMENCLAVWDDHNEIFGNWSNNTQRAAELGMDSWLQRFRNWEQVKEHIAQGLPVIASIRFDGHTFENSPVFPPDEGTDGHLIVIRGFTRGGDVIVNDPASRKKGNGVIYPAAGLSHAWFGHGGVGYVIRPPATTAPVTPVAVFKK